MKTHFLIESGLKMIQFKTKPRIFILKKSFNRVQNIEKNYSLKIMRKIIQNSEIRLKYDCGALLRPRIGKGPTEID